MYFKQIMIGGFDYNFSYLLGDELTKKVAIVDPDNPQLIEQVIKQEALKPKAILITHGHFDHIAGIEHLLNLFDIPVFAHPKDHPFLEKLNINTLKSLEDNQTISIGDIEIKVLHTPGHSPGSCCFFAESKLITGDTLFIEGCGHCRSLGGNSEHLYESLKKINNLPSSTTIYPGHDYGSKPFNTLKEERLHNPYLRLLDNKEVFIKKREA